MPEPRPGYLLDMIRTASDLDFGLLIETDNVDTCRSSIYYALKSEGLTSEDFDLQVIVPSTPNTIYLLRRSVELPE